MLIEQAFLMLPEILHGSGYQQQDYEAGLVGAFSLALLQVLNGHNAPNPIGCLQHERMFREQGAFQFAEQPRFLRADLFLISERLRVANRRLSQYGWRHDAWLEAKFLRGQAGQDGQQHSTNKTNHVAAILADIVRLVTLVPEGNAQSRTARYLLHVYDAHPDRYLTFRIRPWTRALTEPGQQTFEIADLGQERQTVRNLLGDLHGLSVRVDVTNLVLFPIDETHRPIYYCCLTRFDGFTCTQGDNTASLNRDRTVVGFDNEHFDRVAAFVADRIHIKRGSPEETAPVEPGANLEAFFE